MKGVPEGTHFTRRSDRQTKYQGVVHNGVTTADEDPEDPKTWRPDGARKKRLLKKYEKKLKKNEV